MPTSKWGVKERFFSFMAGGKGEGGFFDIHNVASAQIIFLPPTNTVKKYLLDWNWFSAILKNHAYCIESYYRQFSTNIKIKNKIL